MVDMIVYIFVSVMFDDNLLVSVLQTSVSC
jgi:hypothetical protein